MERKKIFFFFNYKILKVLKKIKREKHIYQLLLKILFIICLLAILSILSITPYKSCFECNNNKTKKLNNPYQYCFECIENNINNNIIDQKCYDCPNEILFKDIYMVGTNDTLDEIIKFNKSISRYGDGEFAIIDGKGTNFQEYNKKLSERLIEVLNSNENNLLVGIGYFFQKEKLDEMITSGRKFWVRWMNHNKFKLLKILKRNKYYSADITRFYYKYKDKSDVPNYIKKLKKLWEGRDILIIEGEKSRVGIGNDLLKEAKTIKRIICPEKHAFRVYDKILNAALKIDKNYLVLIALGPTACVLAYDLNKNGYQAIDFGHTDIQYELYLRNSTKMIKIPFKFVVEYKKGRNKIDDVKDINYYNQIVEKILY